MCYVNCEKRLFEHLIHYLASVDNSRNRQALLRGKEYLKYMQSNVLAVSHHKTP